MLGWGTLFLRIFVSALMLKVHELLPWERRTDKGLYVAYTILRWVTQEFMIKFDLIGGIEHGRR